MAKGNKEIWRNIWKRGEDGDYREQRSFVRYAIVSTALFMAFFLLKRDGLVTWVQSGIAIRRQASEIKRLERENKALDARIDYMSGDRDTLERFARENFYFSAPGDDVYIVGP